MRIQNWKVPFGALLIIACCLALVWSELGSDSEAYASSKFVEFTRQELLTKTMVKEEPKKMDEPGKFAQFHRDIRTRFNETEPGYTPGYIYREKQKLFSRASSNDQRVLNSARTASTAYNFSSRGPYNVPGRTRGLIAMPDDEDNHWFAGAVAGGIWETLDAGVNWKLSTPEELSYSITWLDFSPVNPDIIYASTGEQQGSTRTTHGVGILKTTDGGVTWTQLPATIQYTEPAIWRIIVDPSDADTFLYCTSQGSYGRGFSSSIYKSTDGGKTIRRVYESNSWVTQLIHDEGDFNTLYGAALGQGVLKSIDGGENWVLYSEGFGGAISGGRLEIAVSRTNGDILYASAESTATGNGSDLFVSTDAGLTWSLMEDQSNGNVDFLGGQGWYDNTIMVDPFDENVVYLGGVNVWKMTFDPNIPSESEKVLDYGVTFSDSESLWSLVSFGSAQYAQGTLFVNDEPTIDVEIRTGPGIGQKAHRFTVDMRGAGVPDADYKYQDYVDVPFEVWDVTNNNQLMVSFRDQQENEVFDLILENTSSDGSQDSREYIFIHNVPYQDTPGSGIAQASSASTGHQFQNIYFFWPFLSPNSTWDAENLPSETISIDYRLVDVNTKFGTIENVSDAYLEYTEKNAIFGNELPEAFHPDHHNLLAFSINEENNSYRILNGSDGGVYASNQSATPGINDGDWTFSGFGYISGQFYGADKAPGVSRYIGGLQDQGTWVSSNLNEEASASTPYIFSIGGDGFEALWNYGDGDELIGGSQNNGFNKTFNGGANWVNATSGLSGDGPFITRLANSNARPDFIYCLTTEGVGRSTNFGTTWQMTPITENYGFTSSTSIEVSIASSNIVWAGAGMNAGINLHVSTDHGTTFTSTVNYENDPLGAITGIATHPFEKNTAYALFSFAASPKILKTEDLGQTWTDISGFSGNDSSSTGFPDVAVYSLLIRPDNTDIIWAGTEIGLVESTDNAQSWNLVPGFPPVPIWQLKIVDDQVVIATHGRGIYSTTLNDLPDHVFEPDIGEIGLSPAGLLGVQAIVNSPMDSFAVVIDDIIVFESGGSIAADTVFNFDFETEKTSGFEAYLIGYKGEGSYYTLIKTFDLIQLEDAIPSYVSTFDDISNLDFAGFEEISIRLASGFGSRAIHTEHPYLDASALISGERNYVFQLKKPIVVSSSNSMIEYSDIAIIEPGEEDAVFGEEEFYDYVVVEGSVDGASWIPLADGYDANADAEWLTAYRSQTNGNANMYVRHEVDISGTFDPGQEVLIRFRLFSDFNTTSYGWVIDDLNIQGEFVLSEELDVAAFKVYPNPTSDRINFDRVVDEVNVVSLEGKVIFKSSNVKGVDISQLERGIYIISLRKGKLTENLKIVKE